MTFQEKEMIGIEEKIINLLGKMNEEEIREEILKSRIYYYLLKDSIKGRIKFLYPENLKNIAFEFFNSEMEFDMETIDFLIDQSLDYYKQNLVVPRIKKINKETIKKIIENESLIDTSFLEDAIEEISPTRQLEKEIMEIVKFGDLDLSEINSFGKKILEKYQELAKEKNSKNKKVVVLNFKKPLNEMGYNQDSLKLFPETYGILTGECDSLKSELTNQEISDIELAPLLGMEYSLTEGEIIKKYGEGTLYNIFAEYAKHGDKEIKKILKNIDKDYSDKYYQSFKELKEEEKAIICFEANIFLSKLNFQNLEKEKEKIMIMTKLWLIKRGGKEKGERIVTNMFSHEERELIDKHFRSFPFFITGKDHEIRKLYIQAAKNAVKGKNHDFKPQDNDINEEVIKLMKRPIKMNEVRGIIDRQFGGISFLLEDAGISFKKRKRISKIKRDENIERKQFIGPLPKKEEKILKKLMKDTDCLSKIDLIMKGIVFKPNDKKYEYIQKMYGVKKKGNRNIEDTLKEKVYIVEIGFKELRKNKRLLQYSYSTLRNLRVVDNLITKMKEIAKESDENQEQIITLELNKKEYFKI